MTNSMTGSDQGITWRKPDGSNSQGACFEVGQLPGTAPVRVRDSKNPAGPALVFGPVTWQAFTTVIKKEQR